MLWVDRCSVCCKLTVVMCVDGRYGVKYFEMYLNTNTVEGFKYKYKNKYYKMQTYLNTNTLGKISNIFQNTFM